MKGRPTLRRLLPATAAARHPRRPTPQAPRPPRIPPPARHRPLRQTRPHPQARPRLRQPRPQRQAVRCTAMSLGSQLHVHTALSDALLLCAAAFHSLHTASQANQTAPASSYASAPDDCSCSDQTPNSGFSCSQAVRVLPVQRPLAHVSSEHACRSHVQATPGYFARLYLSSV